MPYVWGVSHHDRIEGARTHVPCVALGILYSSMLSGGACDIGMYMSRVSLGATGVGLEYSSSPHVGLVYPRSAYVPMDAPYVDMPSPEMRSSVILSEQAYIRGHAYPDYRCGRWAFPGCTPAWTYCIATCQRHWRQGNLCLRWGSTSQHYWMELCTHASTRTLHVLRHAVCRGHMH